MAVDRVDVPRGKVVFRDVGLPGRIDWWHLRRIPDKTAHEATLSLRGGEAYTLQQLLAPDFIPGIGQERYAILVGELSTCAIGANGAILSFSDAGEMQTTRAIVSDLSTPLQGRGSTVIDITSPGLRIPGPEDASHFGFFADAEAIHIPGQIPFGRLHHIILRSAPQTPPNA